MANELLAAQAARTRISALDVYERGLASHQLWARDDYGVRFRLPVADWASAAIPGDASLIARCSGPALDVGCGPGRLVSALAQCGIEALGIDISAGAVARARKLGANALRCSVFGRVPKAGSWRCAMLADGNIGIGGDPALLLRTVGRLLGPGGRVLVEVAAPGVSTRVRQLQLEDEHGFVSESFAWAEVGAQDVDRFARAGHLDVTHRWSASRRWFVELRKV